MTDINQMFKEVKAKLEKENKPERTFNDFVREFWEKKYKKEFKIRAYDKNEKNLIDKWKKQCKEANQELYNFDKIEVDFKGKYVDFIDTRYYTDEKFKNKSILAPIRQTFDELDILDISIS